jgi:hypothetical protein
MLRRNNLISAPIRNEVLGAFLERLNYAVLTLLDGATVDEAFSGLGGRLRWSLRGARVSTTCALRGWYGRRC